MNHVVQLILLIKHKGENKSMKIYRAIYNDDGVKLEGFLIKRAFHKPIFYPFDRGCGFNYQVITSEQKENIIVVFGAKGTGKRKNPIIDKEEL